MKTIDMFFAFWLGLAVYHLADAICVAMIGSTKTCAHGYIYARVVPMHEYRQLIDANGNGVRCDSEQEPPR